jgi:hypothetical protein
MSSAASSAIAWAVLLLALLAAVLPAGGPPRSRWPDRKPRTPDPIMPAGGPMADLPPTVRTTPVTLDLTINLPFLITVAGMLAAAATWAADSNARRRWPR